LARGEITRRLRALGARCRAEGEAIAVTPPSYRGDLRQEEDLIEEIARVGGYEAIPTTLPDAPITHGADTPTRAFVQRVRAALVAEGLAEMVTVSLTDDVTNQRLPGFVGRALAPIALRNPLSSESSELRRSPLAAWARIASSGGPQARSASSTRGNRRSLRSTARRSASSVHCTPRSCRPAISREKCGSASLTWPRSLTMFRAASRRSRSRGFP